MAMGVATDSLNRLFSDESTLLRAVRDIGLGSSIALPALKSLFIRQAAGLVRRSAAIVEGRGAVGRRIRHMWTAPIGKHFLTVERFGLLRSYVRPFGAAL